MGTCNFFIKDKGRNTILLTNSKMLRFLMLATVVVLAVSANEMSVEEMMKEGMKVMKKEGRLGELEEKEVMMLGDLKTICTGACNGGSAAIGLLCKVVPGIYKVACYGVMFAGPVACNSFCKLFG